MDDLLPDEQEDSIELWMSETGKRNTEDDPIVVSIEQSRELLGISFVEDPLVLAGSMARRQFGTIFVNQLPASQPGQPVKVAGKVVAVKEHITKNRQSMLFVTIEDPTGQLPITVFPRTLAMMGSHFILGNFVLIEGKSNHRPDAKKKKQEEEDADDQHDDTIMVKYEITCDNAFTIGTLYG